MQLVGKVMILIIKFITVFAIILIIIKYYPYLNPSSISAFIKENNTTAPVIFIIICSARPILFFLPSMGLTVVAGVLFGTLWGTVYVVIGGAFSTLVGFYFARWLGRDLVEKMLKKNKIFMKTEAWSKEHGEKTILYLRLFNMPWDLVSYWAGLSGLRFKGFYVASLTVLVPVSLLYTYFGSHVFTPYSLGFVIPLIIMLMMGAAPYIKEKKKKKTNA
jgi:uncharacterized membrane protein YdjX (TVP38/TMEM64 family)